MRIAAILLSVLAVACSGDSPVTPTGCPPTCPVPKAIQVVFTGGTLSAELATLRGQRDTGLMNRASIAPDSGMLFVWAVDQSPNAQAFWMRNTHFDLAVAFVDAARRVINIEFMTKDTDDLHFATAPFRYAVEAPRNWFVLHGVGPGAIADFTIPAGVIIDP